MSQFFDMTVYRQYKSDTNSIAEYLSRTAKAHGFNEATLRSNGCKDKPLKLKGRERKLMRDANKHNSSENQNRLEWYRHKLQAQDFLDLAQFIANHFPPIEVPFTFIAVLDRTVAMRTRVANDTYGANAAWAAGNNGQITHDYFIKVLVQVRDILRPCLPRSTKIRRPEPLSTPTPTGAPLDYGNMFSGLHVENPTDISNSVNADVNVNIPHEKTDVKLKNNKTPEHKLPEVVADTDTGVDAAAALAALFEEYSKFRSVIGKTWKMYKMGQCDLVSASLTTNVALELARFLQNDQMAIFRSNGGFEVLYSRYAASRVDAANQSVDPDPLKNAENYYHATADFCRPAWTMLKLFFAEHEPGKLCVSNIPLSPAIEQPMPYSIDTLPKNMQDLLDIMPRIGQRANDGNTVYDADEISRAIFAFLTSTEITAYTLLAIQVYLDIQHILDEEVSRCFTDLQRMADAVQNTVDQFRHFQHIRWPGPLRDAFDRHLGGFTTRVSSIFNDHNGPPSNENDGKVENSGDVKYNADGPSNPRSQLKHHDIWKHHPLMCGIEAYAVKTCFHNIGHQYCSTFSTIVHTAHLYNAVRQEQLLTKAWTDMELLFTVQPTKHLFIGKRPLGAEQYFSRLMMSMGESAANFAPTRRPRAAWSSSGRDVAELQQMAPVTLSFADRYVFKDDRNVLRQGDIEAIVRRSKRVKFDDFCKSVSNPSKDASASRETARNSGSPAVGGHIDLFTLICHLRGCFVAEAPELSFDYFDMFRQCCSVLAIVHEACSPLIKMLGGPPPQPNNPFMSVVSDIFGWMMAEKRMSPACCNCKNHKMPSHEILRTAAEVMEEWMESQSSSSVDRMAKNVLGLWNRSESDEERDLQVDCPKPTPASEVDDKSTHNTKTDLEPRVIQKSDTTSTIPPTTSSAISTLEETPPPALFPNPFRGGKMETLSAQLSYARSFDPKVFDQFIAKAALIAPTVITDNPREADMLKVFQLLVSDGSCKGILRRMRQELMEVMAKKGPAGLAGLRITIHEE